MTKFRLLLRRRRVAVVASILIGVLAGVVSSITGSGGRDITTWEAMQVVFVNFDSGQLASAAVINQAAQQATIGDVPTAAKEILKSKLSAKALAKKVSAKAVVESGTIEIKARDTNKKLALRYVQAFGQAFVESSNRELKDAATKKFDATKKRVDEAKAALDEYDAFLSANTGQAQGVEEAIRAQKRRGLEDAWRTATGELAAANATVESSNRYFTIEPEEPVALDSLKLGLPDSLPLRVTILTAIASLFGVAMLLIIEKINPRFDTRDEVTEVLSLPVIGEIATLPRAYIQGKDRTKVSLDLPTAEAYRRLRSAFQFIMNRRAAGEDEPGVEAEPDSTVFLIISSTPEEGKSTTAAMTGLAMAEAGVPTLVLGCDYRRPTIDRLLGVPGSKGITSRVVMSIDRPELSEIVHKTEWPDLWAAPSGRPTRSVAGCAEVAGEIIGAARENGVSVLIDTTPVLVANDAMDLVDQVDEIVLVIRAGHTSQRAARRAIDQVTLHGRSILGVVLIGVVALGKDDDYYSYYESDLEEHDDELHPPRSDGELFARDAPTAAGDAGNGSSSDAKQPNGKPANEPANDVANGPANGADKRSPVATASTGRNGRSASGGKPRSARK